jgi:hypothetical protein
VLDSTPLYDAVVATMDTITLIRSAIRNLLKVADGGLRAELWAVLSSGDDYASSAKPQIDWDDKEAQAELIDSRAHDAYALLALLDGRGLDAVVSQAAVLLATVTGQDLEATDDGVFSIARRVAKDRVISTVDSESRHGHKTSAHGFDGFKTHIAIDPDSEIITATVVSPGNAGDASIAEELIEDLLASDDAAENERPTLGRIRNGLGGRYYKTKKQVDTKVAQILTRNVAGLITVTTATRAGKPVITWRRDDNAIAAAGALDGLYALATNLPDPKGGRLDALEVLRIYKDQWIVEQRHRDLKQTLRVRPVFLHNDDRIESLIAVIGIALLIFGLIEAELRAALGDGVALPAILPESRAAKPTARAALAAFDGLSVTYTPAGLVLDRLTQVQRIILALLGVSLPWPESKEE